MLYVLLEFCEAFFNGQQTLQSVCLRVLKKVKMIGRLARKVIDKFSSEIYLDEPVLSAAGASPELV